MSTRSCINRCCQTCKFPTGRLYRTAAQAVPITVRSYNGRCQHHHHRYSGSAFMSTATTTNTSTEPEISYRQQLKQEKKRVKESNQSHRSHAAQRRWKQEQVDKWELTVGIEIHAELDTERKLFSSALTSNASSSSSTIKITNNDEDGGRSGHNNTDDSGRLHAAVQPNTNVALHDLAYPGAQPVFQIGTVVPAVRAALALGCRVHRRSAFDRKHYFYADQPAGYQITQFYQPFATGGEVVLGADDGVVVAPDALTSDSSDDQQQVRIGIERVQLEQDTAKSLVGGADGKLTLLDFNRTSHPLIEIVSRPDIHSPRHAAAYVRKVQEMLRVVGAVTAGMESGGLRADVNVSVRRRRGAVGSDGDDDASGTTSLGQRTEIKNLSSLRAIEDAIAAERDRQIRVIEAGGTIQSETRGWTLGGSETVLLRSKEGEVDYRYMPDPDIPPLIIADELVQHLRNTTPALPDNIMSDLQRQFGISSVAARTLYQADDGARLKYLAEVVDRVEQAVTDESQQVAMRKTTSNFVIHEIPSLSTKHDTPWSPDLVPVERLVELVLLLGAGKLHKHGAKTLLRHIFLDTDSARSMAVAELAQREGLLLEPVPDGGSGITTSASPSSPSSSSSSPSSSSSSNGSDESNELISALAKQVFEANAKMVRDVLVKQETKKINFFAGQVMRELGALGKARAVDPKYVSELVHRVFWDTHGNKE